MKLKLNLLHKVGIAALLLGIAVLIFGMVVLYRCLHVRDISEMTFDEVKSGTYVKGNISGVLLGYNDGMDAAKPLTLYTTDSDDTDDGAYQTYFLIELKNDRGKYVSVIIDEFRDFDLYHQIFEDTPATELKSFDVEGIVTYKKSDEEMVKQKVSEFKDTYPYLYYDHQPSSGLSDETVSPCCIEIKPIGARKLWWLYSIPLLFAGISLLILGGRPYERIK